ncbi:CU044_2847 family protein [Streptomyces sparsogenes]|uniref:CU044_2847 family protein n=1 Tax=Streptomyces sparsogenes TaxID=67365 RepID=UPI00082513B9|nr:CU044_2847 family protein [Streptomyces sparsogenes]
MSTQQVSYALDDETIVRFEIEEADTFRPVGTEEVVGRVREAVRPAVEAARAVLDRIREVRPAEVEVKFGVKASGTAQWVVAKAATEANFEITLVWRPDETSNAAPDSP